MTIEKLTAICQILRIDLITLFTFDESLIFKHYTDTAEYLPALASESSGKLCELYEKLLQSKNEEISLLKEMINTLTRN